MTANPLLKRLLGEATPDLAQQARMPEPEDQARERFQPEPPESEAATEPIPDPNGPQDSPERVAPTQELIQQWRQGDHMAVAARLMFTEASYADFVDLVFAIGHSEGRELGQLLDELADTEGMEPPSTPPEYKSILSRVAGADEEESVL